MSKDESKMSKGVILTTHSVYSSFDSEMNPNKKSAGDDVKQETNTMGPTMSRGSRRNDSRLEQPESGIGSRINETRMSNKE